MSVAIFFVLSCSIQFTVYSQLRTAETGAETEAVTLSTCGLVHNMQPPSHCTCASLKAQGLSCRVRVWLMYIRLHVHMYVCTLYLVVAMELISQVQHTGRKEDAVFNRK